MKRTVLLLLLALIGCNQGEPTRRQTQKWITSKIKHCGSIEEVHDSGTIIGRQHVRFNCRGELVVLLIIEEDDYKEYFESRIPISYIVEVWVSEGKDAYEVFLETQNKDIIFKNDWVPNDKLIRHFRYKLFPFSIKGPPVKKNEHSLLLVKNC